MPAFRSIGSKFHGQTWNRSLKPRCICRIGSCPKLGKVVAGEKAVARCRRPRRLRPATLDCGDMSPLFLHGGLPQIVRSQRALRPGNGAAKAASCRRTPRRWRVSRKPRRGSIFVAARPAKNTKLRRSGIVGNVSPLRGWLVSWDVRFLQRWRSYGAGHRRGIRTHRSFPQIQGSHRWEQNRRLP